VAIGYPLAIVLMLIAAALPYVFSNERIGSNIYL